MLQQMRHTLKQIAGNPQTELTNMSSPPCCPTRYTPTAVLMKIICSSKPRQPCLQPHEALTPKAALRTAAAAQNAGSQGRSPLAAHKAHTKSSTQKVSCSLKPWQPWPWSPCCPQGTHSTLKIPATAQNQAAMAESPCSPGTQGDHLQLKTQAAMLAAPRGTSHQTQSAAAWNQVAMASALLLPHKAHNHHNSSPQGDQLQPKSLSD